MKKLLVTFLGAFLFLCGPNASAQLTSGDGTLSFGGGFTSFGIGGPDADLLERMQFPNMIPGFYFGASIDYAFSAIEGLTVEPGAYIAHYGKAFQFGLAGEPKSYHANYLRVPLDLKYTFTMDDSAIGIAVYTGPRFNIGVGGNMFSAGKTYPGLRPFDAQWGFGLAFTLQDAIVIRGGYDIGITNCIKNNKDLSFDDLIIKRHTLTIGANFLFK
ncbi:MAG: PorT family protein [Bacteroidales bacterium]|nr:outer membrane beta-barrel protein [Bacteroidales bacterium]MCR5463974.1 PorT family protein [Bacteroidales bacterium]